MKKQQTSLTSLHEREGEYEYTSSVRNNSDCNIDLAKVLAVRLS